MFKNQGKATTFEQDELRLPNGDYRDDAPDKLRVFWKTLGIVAEFEHGPVGNVIIVTHMRCAEDIS